MNKLLLFILFFSIILTTNLNARSDIEDELMHLSAEFGGRIGVAAKSVNTNETILVNADQKFPSASIIKIPIMVEFFCQVSEGKLDPLQRVQVNESDKCGGSGVLKYTQGSQSLTLIDAVLYMIILSDNTATNAVIEALGISLQDGLNAINLRMKAIGLKNTRLLNKMMSWSTKTDSPESIRYGVGVTTPSDMSLLLEKMYHGELISPEYCQQMIDVLKKQQYDSMIPRYLPSETMNIEAAHKTGGVTESKNDAGIIFSPNGDYVVSIFCDEADDHRDSPDNAAIIAAAKASRIVWNHFTGEQGFDCPKTSGHLNWNEYPSGKWAKLELKYAPFPHPDRMNGYTNSKGVFFSFEQHYCDSSTVVIVPKSWYETEKGLNLIVHFHGHNNYVLDVLEQFDQPQQLTASKKNAILILAQGPKYAPDSFCGQMTEPDGFKKYLEEILETLVNDGMLHSTKINTIIISAHSGGYHPAAFTLDVGGLTNFISEVYLFDAFYGQHNKFLNWIKNYEGRLISIYTDHLADEHEQFFKYLKNEHISFQSVLSKNNRLMFLKTDVCHDCVLRNYFESCLKLSQLEEIQ